MGDLPGAKQLAVLPGSNSDSFSIIDTRTGKMVLEGKQGSEAVWTPSGERVRVADFSTITAPGEYLVEGYIDPQVLATVTAWCARLDVLATDMRVEQRSLEDVFLELTGRELRA